MEHVLWAMALIIAAGVVFRHRLGVERAERIRLSLTQSVYQLFLPALVLQVLWRTPVDANTLRIPLIASVSVVSSMLLAYGLYDRWGTMRRRLAGSAVGALLLASAFGNFTYLGLPVLAESFGAWARYIAIDFDLLASTPLLFSLGVVTARYYGLRAGGRPFVDLLRVPALWAAILGLACSLTHVPMPVWLERACSMLGGAVVPLMLLSVGMALRWQASWWQRVPLLLPMLFIQLLFMPIVAWGAAWALTLPTELLAPVVIEGAMPSMVLGLVICDRFRLDASLYAEAVTLSTLLSLFTLPLWLQWLR